MPRVARGLADGLIYHILNRGNGLQQVFHNDEDYRAFVDLMRQAKERHQVKLLAWCLMPDHFHLLLSPESAADLSRWMQWLMTSHVRRHHRLYKSSGHVWQGRYKSFIVQEDSRHLLPIVRYIEASPVMARLAPSAGEWRWSSHGGRTGSAPPIVDALPITLPEPWTNYVDTHMKAVERERIEASVRRQTPFGAPHWQARMCQELGLESTLKPKGRPRKQGRKK